MRAVLSTPTQVKWRPFCWASMVTQSATPVSLVTVTPDPDNGRRKVVTLTDRGRELREIAVVGIGALEAVLEQRIGADRLAALHDALDADWGPSDITTS